MQQKIHFSKRKKKGLYALTFLLLLCFNTSLQAQITGDTQVCFGEEINYSSSTMGATYVWDVQGGTYTTLGNGSNILVTWNDPGSASVNTQILLTVIENDGTSNDYNLSVILNPSPNTEIQYTPFLPQNTKLCGFRTEGIGKEPILEGIHSDKIPELQPIQVITKRHCIQACEFSTMTYSTPFNANSNYQWNIQGGTINGNSNNEEIEVLWDEEGTGYIEVVETNEFGCTSMESFCVDIINSPIANFNVSSTNICLEQEVHFTDASTNAYFWEWNFGDGTTSDQQNPSHSYSNSGIYTASLTVTNECGCTHTQSIDIEVEAFKGPNIECASTLCANDSDAYWTEDISPCDIYDWTVTGGSIVSSMPYNETIQVDWGGGPVGTVSLSFPCSTSPSHCPAPSQIIIPLVGDNLMIEGDNSVCYYDFELYQIPEFMGVNCNWSVTSTGASNSLYSVNGNQVIVIWRSDGTLSVELEHSLLDCVAFASFDAEVKPEFGIGASSSICEGDDLIINSLNELMQWEINPGGHTFVNQGTPFYWDASPLSPGTYTLTGTLLISDDYCNTIESTIFEVMASPTQPLSVNGERQICPNTSYFYDANANPLEGGFEWNINDGGILSTASGNPIAVTWNSSGPYELSVKQTSNDFPNCESQELLINDFEVVELNTSINGDTEVCTNEANTYTISTPAPNLIYEWTINPPNAGSIVLGQGNNSIDIQWHNQSISAVIEVAVCGSSQSLTVNINEINPTPSLITSGELCEGGNIDLIANTGFSQYEFLDETGTTLNTGSSNSFNITTGGYYSVIVTDTEGCTQISNPFYVHENPAPTAHITTPDATSYCPGANVNTVLYALESTGYTYLWNTGATTSVITVTSTGTYIVTVTNSSGCTNTESISVTNNTCIPSDPPCSNDYTLNATLQGTSCNEFEYEALPANPTTYNFNFDDGISNSSSTNIVTYSYNQAGYYRPKLNVSGSCTALDIITVPVAANFDVIPSCVGGMTEFIDISTYLPTYSISSWAWDINEDGITDYTTANPTHSYTSSGTYEVTLIVTSNTGCTAEISQDIEVAPLPTANINAPVSSCLFEAVDFSDASTGNIVQWEWDFGDFTSSNLANVSHAYTSTGVFTVSLTVIDATGCTHISQQTIEIEEPTIESIDVSQHAICQGDLSILIAPLGNSYLWSNGSTSQSIAVAQAGVYSVEVEDLNSCKYSSPPETITVIPLPDAEIRGLDEICRGDRLRLQAPYSSNYTYEWSDGTATVFPSMYYLSHKPLSGTHTYTLIVTDNNTGCEAVSLPFTVIVHDLPTKPDIQITNGNQSFCEGETATLTAIVGSDITDVLWNTGETSESIEVTEGGTYTVMVTNENGCTNSYSELIKVNPIPDLKSIPTGCYEINCPDSLCAPSGYAFYEWIIETEKGKESVKSPCVYLEESGTYSLLVATLDGCISMASFELEVGNCSPCYNIEEIANYELLDGSDYPDGRIITPSSPEAATVFDSGGGIYFRGHLIVEDFTLNISNMHFVFEEGAKLTFRNSTVNFNNSVFEPCEECDTWEGMEFEGNAYGQFNECVLKNAETAMDVHSRQGLRISNNEFINCHTSIYLRPNPFLRYSYDEGITGNTFLVDRFCDDLFEDNEYFGVQLENLRMTGLVSQNDFVNATYANNDYLKFYGVRAVKGVSATISQNTFTNLFRSIDINQPINMTVENNRIETTKALYPDALDASILDGYYHQIRISDAVETKVVEVFGNTIQSSQNFASIQISFTNENFSSSAIYVSKSEGVNIRENTVKGYRTGIMMISSNSSQIADNTIDGAYSYGIYVKNIERVNIACNVINMDRLLKNENTIGIGFFNTKTSFKNEIYSNCIFESSIPMLFQNFGGKQSLPYIRNNYLYNYDLVGILSLGFAGNIGINSPSSYQNYGRNTFIANSNAFDIASSSTIPAHGNYGVNTSIGVNIGKPSLPSTASCGHQIIGSGFDKHEFILAEVCNKLTPMLYNPIKQIGGKWLIEEVYKSDLAEMEESERLTSVVTWMQFLASNDDDYQALDELYNNIYSSSFFNSREQLWITYHYALSKYDHELADKQLALLFIEEDADKGCIFVEDLQLQIKMGVLELNDLSEEEISRLKEIDENNEGCSVSARDLLHSVLRGHDYLFERTKKVDIEAILIDFPELLTGNQIEVYPNPSKDLVNISFNRNYDEETATLQVFAVDGRLMKEIEVISYRGSVQLDVSDLLDGVYILSLQSENLRPITTKFHKIN